MTTKFALMVGVALGAALSVPPAGALHFKPYGAAEAPQMELECGNPSLAAGSPMFRTAPAGMAEYSFRGLCKGVNQQVYVTYWTGGTWTPTETDPRRANASESYNIQLNNEVWQTREADAQGRGSVVFLLGAHCNMDPWLHPRTAVCTPTGNNIPDDVRRAWPALATAGFPLSRNGIPGAQLQKLLADYERLNPPRVAATPRVGPSAYDTKVTEANRYGAMVKPHEAGGGMTQFTNDQARIDTRRTLSEQSLQTQVRVSPPEILAPAPGSAQTQGRLRVQVKPSTVSGNAIAEVEFSWLEPRRTQPSQPPPAAAPAAVVWKVPMAQLAQGAVVPAASGPTQTGPWLVRVRSGAGAWSTGVSFNFATGVSSRVSAAAIGDNGVLTRSVLNPQPLPPKSQSESTQGAKAQDKAGARNWSQAPAILGK